MSVKKQETRNAVQRVLTKSVEGFEIRVQGFNDWFDAILEIRTGESKLTIAKKLRPTFTSQGVLTKLIFPQKIENAKDKLILTLLFCYPNGLTIDILASVIDSKPKTVSNLLTDTSKGISHNFEKQVDDYKIQSGSLYWALCEFERIVQNFN